MERIRRSAVIWLISIGLYHVALILAVISVLYFINLDSDRMLAFGNGDRNLWINAALLGFLGSLLYFSRKAYVYLISDKLVRVEAEIASELKQIGQDSDSAKIERYKIRLIGYYFYLAARPIGGLVIGPLMTMIILGGLTTLSKKTGTDPSVLSAPGVNLVYLFSFIGGYTSSDMFDWLTQAGSRLASKVKID